MSLLCRFGWHRWRYRSQQTGLRLSTWARCDRPGCRYNAWMIVDVSDERWWIR